LDTRDAVDRLAGPALRTGSDGRVRGRRPGVGPDEQRQHRGRGGCERDDATGDTHVGASLGRVMGNGPNNRDPAAPRSVRP